MKAALKLEYIGADSADWLNAMCRQLNVAAPGFGDRFIGRPSPGPWVAQIVGVYPSGKLQRTFLHSNRDYTAANSKGSRGVYLWFTLETDKLYEVHARVSWQKSNRFFVAVTENGEVKNLNDQEGAEWLSAL